MHYRLVLWDFDGTLADTGKDVWRSLDYAARRCGGRITSTFSQDDSNLAEPMDAIFSQIRPFPGDQQLESFVEHVRMHYRTMNDYSETNLYPGILSLVSGLQRGGTVNHIITNKPLHALERILGAKGWDGLFDGWSTSDGETLHMHRESTKTEMITNVLEQYSGLRDRCIYIGDTWSDVAAARANQIDCVAVTYGDGDACSLRTEHPTYCVDDVSALSALLKKGL